MSISEIMDKVFWSALLTSSLVFIHLATGYLARYKEYSHEDIVEHFKKQWWLEYLMASSMLIMIICAFYEIWSA